MGTAEPPKQRVLHNGGRDVTLLYVKCKRGNSKVGNVLELLSGTSFLWVSLNFWPKFMAGFIPDLFLYSVLSVQLAC